MPAQTRTAFITGANKGLGLETARQLGKQGITVLIGARDPGRGKEAAQQLKTDGLDARPIGEGVPMEVEDGALTGVWLATLLDDGPTGGFYHTQVPPAMVTNLKLQVWVGAQLEIRSFRLWPSMNQSTRLSDHTARTAAPPGPGRKNPTAPIARASVVNRAMLTMVRFVMPAFYRLMEPHRKRAGRSNCVTTQV